jgi:hypothetical protein
MSQHIAPGYLRERLQQNRTIYHLLPSERLPMASRCRFLRLCADSAHPPGMTTHNKCTKDNGITTDNNTCFQRHRLVMTPTFFSTSKNDKTHLSTTYYHNTTPSITDICVLSHSNINILPTSTNFNLPTLPNLVVHGICALALQQLDSHHLSDCLSPHAPLFNGFTFHLIAEDIK